MAPRPFTEVTSAQAKAALVRRFIPLADRLRDLLTRFGLRSYRVALVYVQWSGGERGVGVPSVVREVPLLPTPKVSTLASISEIVQPVGLDEVGSIELSQVSGRFTEEELRGLGQDGSELPPDMEFFYEVEFFPQEGQAQKRRFFPRSPPAYMAGRLQWVVRLEKANEDRARFTGDP